MSIVINNTPASYASMHSDLVYTVYNATNYQQAGYKYICDVYINGSFKYRGKAFPNPVNNNGVFNIGQVVRNYIATQLNPIQNNLRAQEFQSGDFFLDVVCKFGEEFGGTLYTNLTIDSSRRVYNHYNGRLIGVQSILPSYLDKAASNRPYENKVSLTDPFCFLPYFPTSGSAISVQIKNYDLGCNLVSTQNVSVTPTSANYLQQLNVAPGAINALIPNMITAGVSYYTVKIGTTSIYKFTLICEPIFTPYTLHFLNQLGGFESFNFPKVSRFTYDVEKKQYTQLPYRMDGSGFVSYNNSNNVLYDTSTAYASRYKERRRLTTDILTDGEYSWLRELIVSPIVYLQEGIYLTPVSVSDTNYERRKYVNDKITALQVNIEFGEQYNTQFR
jgi:hypothetical protein